MTITVADLKFYTAERMTDFDDGGVILRLKIC